MKILILSDYFDNRGGAVVIARSMAQGFQRAHHDVHIITSVQDKALSGQKIIEGIKIWSVYSKYNLFWRAYRSLYNPQTVRSVAEIIERVGPDIVHAHNIHIYLSYHVLKLAKKSGAKVFLTAHDVMLFHYGKLVEFIDPKNSSCPEKFNYKISVWQQIKKAGKTYNPLRNLIIRRYLKYVDKIFTVSDALKDALVQNGIKNIAVIHNGIDANAWKSDDTGVEEFSNKYGLTGKKIILFGGRLSETKGGREIVLAMSKIVKEITESCILILGKTDNYTAQLTDFAAELKIQDKLVFAGWITGDLLKSAFNICDVVVVPSVCFDSFPTVNLEAMACRKPVVATCFGGSREAVLNCETGYIVNPFNTKMMANRVIDLLKNPEKARQLGEAGYDRVQEEFSLEKMINNYLGWFKN